MNRPVCFCLQVPYLCIENKMNMDAKERIVETASRLFYTQGYKGTGINQIIKEADVAKASLYQHFPSKEDLLIEYLRVTAVDTNETLQSVIDKHDTPREKVLSLFDFLVDFANHTHCNGCNFLNIVSEIPSDQTEIRSLIQKQKNHIRSLFAEILKPIGEEALADQLYVLFDAAMVTSKVYGDTWSIHTTKEIVEKLL